jgi:hypothetical protein
METTTVRGLVRGTFRGLALDDRVFNLRDEQGRSASGLVAAHFTEAELVRMCLPLNSPCEATLERVTRPAGGGGERPTTYTLLGLRPLPE